jgi:DNA (cytosine-5)-methyltransferase 1
MRHPWYEFFAGGGLARLGLGERNWQCTFANDICEKKAAAYRAAFKSATELKVGDIAALTADDLPGSPTLAWASFPCQDLSLAGTGAGLNGKRSGTFRSFWNLIEQLTLQQRAPKVVVLENVTGALTSHSGKDFRTIIGDISRTGYQVGALVMDAVHFLPQSRPRLFIVGLRDDFQILENLRTSCPEEPWHPSALRKAVGEFNVALRRQFVWWKIPEPGCPIVPLTELIQDAPEGVTWNSKEQTARLLRMMSNLNLRKIRAARSDGKQHVGTIYKRMRPTENGEKIQRAELRLDGIAGCLRTPVGGSSRQTILVIEKGRTKSRLLSPREAARLMGVHDSYPLPPKYNDAYHLFGDGVAVPVVKWLSKYLLLPLVLGTHSNESTGNNLPILAREQQLDLLAQAEGT